MKISFILTLIASLNIYASAYSQNIRLEADMNTSIKEVLKTIESQSGYRFFYSDDFNVLDQTVQLKAQDAPMKTILDQIFKDTPASVEYMDGNIVIITPFGKQTLRITGTITDETGEPMPGVNVTVKGTVTGVISDVNGKFSINIPDREAVLIFSFMGYVTQEIAVGDRNTINVNMQEDIKQLEEVVVVGYGVIAKSDLTGSVSTINMEKTTDRAVTSLEQMLQGQVAGVQITQSTGGTGAGITFNIRGSTSITGSNQPLIVIDGYPIDSDNGGAKMSAGSQSSYLGNLSEDNALANLNPNDIASIEILKDASATAIYGSRGANGVVLITTKRGQSGKDRINYNFRYDIQQVRKKIDVLNTVDYINYNTEGFVNSTGAPGSLYNTEAKIADALTRDYNWQDEVFQTAHSQDHQLSLSGGDEKLKYALLLGYHSEEGIIKNSKFDRGSIRINLDREFGSRFKVGLNMSGMMSKNIAALQSSNTAEASMSVILSAISTRPDRSARTIDDEVDVSYSGNPLTLVELCDDQNRVTQIMANLTADYTFLPGFYFRLNGGVQNRATHRDLYHPRGTSLGNLEGGYAYSGDASGFNYLTELTLNLDKTFNQVHKINAVGGYTWQQWMSRTQAINAMNFPNDNMLYYDFSSASSFSAPTTRRNESALSSWLGRVNYVYAGRYLVTVTGRADGSTRLAEGNKWHFFPSFALGWNMHNEAFMQQFHFLSELKLRGSYGLIGNQAISIGATKASLGTGTAVINQTLVTSYSPNNMPNDDLHWETTKQLNLGLDLSLYNSRVRFSFDYYKKTTDDLLISLTIPPSNGYTRYNTNQGTIENTGYEFDLGVKALTGQFKWNVNANLSINRNKVVDLGELDAIMGSTFTAIGGQTLHIAQVGKPMGSFYGYRVIGIYQTEEEVANGPTDSASPAPGSFKYKDITGEGEVNADDREIIGNPYPDFIFGLTNNFSWKGFDLSILIQGSIGQDLINGSRFYLDALAAGYSSFNVSQEAYNNRWIGPGTSYKYPKATSSSTPFDARFTDFIVEDASYVRIKNVTLSYSFNTTRIPFLQNLRLFVSAGNLLTFTKYKGYDPEVNSRAGKGMMPGVDYGSIPQYRTCSFGINVGF